MTQNKVISNLMDYVEWRGDLPFHSDPINDVDLMILCELSYTKMEDLFQNAEKLTLMQLWERYQTAGYDQSDVGYDPAPALKSASESIRFGNIMVTDYRNFVVKDASVQFCAVTYEISDDTDVICFRGTDSTLIGWKEDFNFSTDLVTPAQAFAVDYLNQYSGNKKLILAGHSKGGNLAIFASSFCEEEIQNRIVRIRSYDGPGFQDKIIRKEAYQKIMDRSLLYLPQESVFGLLLTQSSPRVIVASSAIGIRQHNLYTWRIVGREFVKAEGLSDKARILDEVIDTWLSKTTAEQRRQFIDLMFETFEDAGYTRSIELDDHMVDILKAVMKKIQTSESAELKNAVKILYELAAAGSTTLYTDFVEKLKNVLPARKEEV